MPVTVRGHIFPFTKEYGMNQLLMKKIYRFATFFSFYLRVTSACQMMMSDNPTLPSAACWQREKCGSLV